MSADPILIAACAACVLIAAACVWLTLRAHRQRDEMLRLADAAGRQVKDVIALRPSCGAPFDHSTPDVRCRRAAGHAGKHLAEKGAHSFIWGQGHA